MRGLDTYLPQGWLAARLGDVADVQLGKMLDQKRTEGQHYPYLRNVNVRWGHVDTSDLLEMPFREHEVERYSLCPGDVLVCEGGEPGRAAVWRGQQPQIKYQKALHRVRLPNDITPNWLVHLLRRDAYSGHLAKHFTGTTIGHLPREILLEYAVILAPTMEQRRVVDTIDSYLSRLDEAEAALARVTRNLKRYRASILQAAVAGRLVPTEAELARAEGRDYEPASELLKRILGERRRRWEDAELARLKAVRKPPKDDRWRAKYEEPPAPDAATLPSLPEGWCWATFDQITTDLRGGTPDTASDIPSMRAVLRSSAVRQGHIDLNDIRYLTGPSNANNDCCIRGGDLLVTRLSGSLEYVANCAVVPEIRGTHIEFPDRLFRARLAGSTCGSYMQHCFAVGTVRRPLESAARSSAGHQRISLADLRHLPMPLPPLREQQRISAGVDRHLSVLDEVAAAANHGGRRSTRLRQAILKWAFEGKLVDQDPNDEPASVLLERIRAERAQAAAQGTARKPRRGRPGGERRRPTRP